MLCASLTMRQLEEQSKSLTTHAQQAAYAAEIRDMLFQLEGEVTDVSENGVVTLNCTVNIEVLLFGLNETEMLALNKDQRWNGLVRVNRVSITPQEFQSPRVKVVATLERQD